MVEMELVGVRVELPSNAPIVLLRERNGARRNLQIYIGGAEATAIAFALDSVTTPRPMTHDLLRDLLVDLGVSVERIVVTELRDHTFFAEIQMQHRGDLHAVSSRPSDALALAVRTKSPIFANEEVLDEAGTVAGEEEQEAEEVVEEFRRFIDEVDPDDFAC